MPRPIAEMSDAQIDTEIGNYERLKQTGLPRYRELLEARGKRAGFDFEKSRTLIERAARQRKFVSYGELAQTSGVEWSKAYRLIGTHLWDIVRYSHDKDGLILSAIVVNKEHRATGDMNGETLAGFIRAAEQLGERVDRRHGTSEEQDKRFLKEQQAKVFDHYAEAEG